MNLFLLASIILVATAIAWGAWHAYRTSRPGYFWRKAVKEPWFGYDQASEPAQKWLAQVLGGHDDKVCDAMMHDLWRYKTSLTVFFNASAFSNSNGMLPTIYYARYLKAKELHELAKQAKVAGELSEEMPAISDKKGGVS